MSTAKEHGDKRERFLRVVGELMPRINEAIGRITSGQAAMRIPVDKTDPDIVLGECSNALAYARDHLACTPSHEPRKTCSQDGHVWVGTGDERVVCDDCGIEREQTTPSTSAPTVLAWCVQHEGECLGDHPAMLARAKAEICGTPAACGCIETYPQLIPGKVSHGPGCASAASHVAPIHPLVEAVRWILQDAAYKAPEQIGVVAERWIDRLRDAMTQEGKPVSVPSTIAPNMGEASIIAEKYAAMESTKWPHGPEPTDLIAHRNIAIYLSRAFLQKEEDRQYHMNAINRLAAGIGKLGCTSDEVVAYALSATPRIEHPGLGAATEPCSLVDAKAPTAEAEDARQQGSFACPICGLDQPHGHEDSRIHAWLKAQASRFSLNVFVCNESDGPAQKEFALCEQEKANGRADFQAWFGPRYGHLSHCKLHRSDQPGSEGQYIAIATQEHWEVWEAAWSAAKNRADGGKQP